MSTTYEKIYDAVKKIPKGRVATYGQIACMAGNFKMSRVVGNALHVNDPVNIPCYRVVNAKGFLAKAFVFGGILNNTAYRLISLHASHISTQFIIINCITSPENCFVALL